MSIRRPRPSIERMKMKIRHTRVLASALVLLVAGCGAREGAETGAGQLNLDVLGQSYTLKASGAPSATVDADGELRIDGKAVALTPHQRALVRAYHAEIGGIASDGIEIGKQGLALAGKAVTEAFKGILDGNPQTIGPNIEAEGERIKAQALKICDRLAVLRSAQDALAASVPEFAPYAELDAEDIDECRAGADKPREDRSPEAPPRATPDNDAPARDVGGSTRA